MNDFFKKLSFTRRYTEILEACEWDEERVKALFLTTVSLVEKLKKEDQLVSSYSDFEKLLKSKLEGNDRNGEINILLEILKDDLQNLDLFGEYKDDN